MSSGGLIPRKCINDGEDLNFFHSSTAYRDIKLWLHQLNRACFPTRAADGSISICTLDSPPPRSEIVISLGSLLEAFTDVINEAPPDTGPRRFGNVAFRAWYRLVEGKVEELMKNHLPPSTSPHSNELKSYLLGSFGSPERLDYGTGHELSFLAFLACLSQLDLFTVGEERSIVVSIIQPYLVIVRKLILTYTLEPAGSHGVWGLDDHSFLPYIFGSAQLGPPIASPASPTPLQGSLSTAPEPESVTSKPTVAQYARQNMYFSAIQFIYDVKKGPFWEHSPILFNISGIKDGWGKINKGMMKMYDAEVLGKFPVVQHFPFGHFFAWEKDPEAVGSQSSVHAQQQPPAGREQASSVPNDGVGTAAPWAKQGGSHAGTNMPSTRAPWASGGNAAGAAGSAGMAAPWASAPTARMPPPPAANPRGPTTMSSSYGRAPPSGMAPTAVPWKKQDS